MSTAVENPTSIRELMRYVEREHPSPYSAREFDTPDHKEFVKDTRERGHLLTYPAVRPLSDGEYETVGGHKRMEAARRAGLDELPVRVLDIDDWEAARRFIDEHVPIEGGDERGMYGQEEIDHALARLRENWPDERLREIGVLAPYLEEKLASRRSGAMKQGYLAEFRQPRIIESHSTDKASLSGSHTTPESITRRDVLSVRFCRPSASLFWGIP